LLVIQKTAPQMQNGGRSYIKKSLYLSNHFTDIDNLYATWYVYMPSCAVWGRVNIASRFWSQIPKIPIFNAWIGVYKPNAQNIKTLVQ